ncbi:unnamed protein product [Diamesa serratosioi]
MNIPKSGAVFAFGKSHLTTDDSDNNYFFIKNDPVKKLVCGKHQSAVICESGRLFVYGENPCGQLAIGSCENIITKPSCVKEIKKLGQKVKDFQYGGVFSVLLTDANKIFYCGKNIFPFNAKIVSLDGKFKHEMISVPVELTEFADVAEEYDVIRAGDEHIVALPSTRDQLIGWGINSYHQLSTIDSFNTLTVPDVFFKTDADETIKLVECGRLSTVVVTNFNDLYLVGKFGSDIITPFTKIREPIQNSTITQLHLSDNDEIFLVTECGRVFKSNLFGNVFDLRFEELEFLEHKEKIVEITTGTEFVALITESGRCFSSINEDKNNLIESGKLKNFRVTNINAGAEHVLVGVVAKSDRDAKLHENIMNKTYTINFKPIKGLGSGEDNYQEPETGESIQNRLNCEDMTANGGPKGRIGAMFMGDTFDSTRANLGSRATTVDYNESDSKGSNNSSADKKSNDTTIRFFDNGIDMKTNDSARNEDGSDETADEDSKRMPRRKTPMPRTKKADGSIANLDDELVDRDEDELYDDDVSTNPTLNESDNDSLDEYINEENKINAQKSHGHVAIVNGKLKKWISDIKEKGKGLSCKNSDTALNEDANDVHVGHHNGTTTDVSHSKSCSIM